MALLACPGKHFKSVHMGMKWRTTPPALASKGPTDSVGPGKKEVSRKFKQGD